MKTGVKIIGGVVAVIVGIVAVGAIYIANFDPNSHKDLIASKFKDATSRDLQLNGELGLSLFPWLGLTINDINISNAEGFSTEPMLHADHVAVRIKLLPLLSDAYEIDTVKLNGVTVRLEVAGNGTTNWADLAGTAEGGDNASSSSSANFNKLIIGGVDIQNTSLIYDDQSANTHYEVNNLNIQIPQLVYGEPLSLTMSLAAASREPRLQADLQLTSTILYDVDNGLYQLEPLNLTATLNGPSVPGSSAKLNLQSAFSINTNEDTLSLPNLQFTALDTTLNGSLNITDLQSDAPSLTANLNLQGNDLGVLFRILEQNELAARIRSLDSKFNIQANIDANMDSGVVQIPTLQASLLGANINGNLMATNANTNKPTVAGKLQAQGPDLPTLIEVVGILQEGSSSALAQTGRDLSRIRNKRFTLQSEFTANLAEGTIDLPTLQADLLGFTVSGNLAANGIANGGGEIDGKLSLQSDSVAEVLAALGQADLAEVTQSLTLNAQLQGSGDAIKISPFNLSLVVAGSQLGNSPQTLALNADTTANVEDDSLQVDAFTLSGLGLNLHGKLAAAQISTDLAYSGEIEVPTFNARQFMQQLNLEMPNTADASVLQKLSFTSEFQGSANNVALDDFTLVLDDTNINGDLALQDLSKMQGTFNLNIDSINADRYLAPTSDTGAATSSEPSPIPTEDIRTLNLAGKLEIGALTYSGLRLQNIEIPLNASNGVVTLNPLKAQLYDGNFNGNIALDASGSEAIATVVTQLSSINLGALTKDFMQTEYLSGQGSIELNLTGRGNDSVVLKKNLNGNGSLTVADGVLAGVDVGGALAAVETMIRSKSLVTLPQGGNTPFESFGATLNIQSGVVASNDLLIKAPGWQITGAGTLADLRRDTIDFDLVAAVDANTAKVAEQEYDIGNHTLPIACSGNLTSPRCLPDAKAIVAAAVTNAVQERLGNFLRDRLGGGEQAAPATPDANAAPTTPAEPAPAPQQSPEQQLLNNALERLRRR